MTFNSEKLKKDVLGAGQAKVGKHLGCTAATMSLKMQKPDMLRLREFLIICDYLNELPQRYIEKLN